MHIKTSPWALETCEGHAIYWFNYSDNCQINLIKMDCWLLHLCIVLFDEHFKIQICSINNKKRTEPSHVRSWNQWMFFIFTWHISLLEYTALSRSILEWMKNSLLLYFYIIYASFLIYFTWQQPPSSHRALACISTRILHLMFPHAAPHGSGCYGHGPCGGRTCPAPKTPCLHTHFYFYYFP